MASATELTRRMINILPTSGPVSCLPETRQLITKAILAPLFFSERWRQRATPNDFPPAVAAQGVAPAQSGPRYLASMVTPQFGGMPVCGGSKLILTWAR